jgi:hypothetical protein
MPASAATSPAPSALPAVCSDFNPYAYTSDADVACGYKTFPLQATQDLPGGGVEYDYSVNGALTREYLPPPGFEPLTATAAQLAEYGFPLRPADATGLSEWRDEFSNYSGTITPPSFMAESSSTGDDTPSDWGGWYVTGGPFTHAEATYWEPAQDYQPTACTGNKGITFWAGLSGDGSIAQDGTQLGPQGPGTAHQGWYETFPQALAFPVDFYATPGDRVDASVTWQTDGYMRFFMYNYHTGKTYPATDVFLTQPNSRDRVEAVAERQHYWNADHTTEYEYDMPNFATNDYPWTVQWAKADDVGFDSYSTGVREQLYDSAGDLAVSTSDRGAYGYFQEVLHNCHY